MADKNVLIFGEDLKQLDLQTLFLESEFDLNIEKASEEEEAKSHLEKIKELSFIIIDHPLNKKIDSLLTYIQDNSINCPIILSTPIELIDDYKSNKFKIESLILIEKPIEYEEFITAIQDILNIEPDESSMEFSRVPSKRLVSIDFVKNDIEVFIKLSSQKFVKIINCDNDLLDAKNIVTKYIKKGVEYLYVNKFDYMIIVYDFLEEDRNKLEDPNVSIDDKIEVQTNVIEDVHESIKNFSISPQTIEIAQATVKATSKIIEKTPKVGELLKKMIKNKNYIYDLSMLTNYLSCAISMNMDWDSRLSLEKLSYAALLQDISLSDVEIAKIVDIKSEKFQNLKPELQNLVKTHVFKSAELLDEIKDLPSDSRNIILQHHERPAGKGYPRELNQNNTMPLACVFIIAHQFAHMLLTKEIEMKSAPEYFEKTFNKGNFRNPLKAFLKIIS